MGAKLSSSSSSGLSKIKGIKINRDSSSPSNSATSSTISTSKSRTQKTQILTEEQQLPSPRTSSTTSFDTRELPYATLKTEDDRMNAVCISSIESALNITK